MACFSYVRLQTRNLKLAYPGLTKNQILLMIAEQKFEQSGNRLRFPFCLFALFIVICIQFALPTF
uniref:Uncharacterized protein n=1 Tax=Setaria italica TaxID=4555 RepID=K4ANV0_SETIT